MFGGIQLDFVLQDVLDDGAALDTLQGDDLGFGDEDDGFPPLDGFGRYHVAATRGFDLNAQFGEAGLTLHEPVVEVVDFGLFLFALGGFLHLFIIGLTWLVI